MGTVSWILTVVLGGATGLAASEMLSFVPIAGWAAKAAIAGGIRKGMGEAVINYFKERSPLPRAY